NRGPAAPAAASRLIGKLRPFFRMPPCGAACQAAPQPWGGPPGRGALWARKPSSPPPGPPMIDLARLRQAFPERHILYFDSLDSTQRVAAACQPGTIVLADRQLAGQGRHGHTWHSEPGVGIYCSLVLPPSPVLTLALGIATVEAIA